MSHHEVQIEIPKSQRSPTSSTTPKVIFSAGSPAQHKCLKTESTKGSKDGVEGIPMHVFSFADCVLAHSVSEGPAGRREILFQENDESPVKGPSRAQKEREMEKEKAMSPKPFMQLYKMESAPEIVSEVKEKTKSPSHAALESILNLILKEQGENDRKKQGISTPEKPRNLSSNLVNKFSGLQKGNSHNSSQISLHERSNSNLLSNDRTTEKSSRIYTEPPSKGHSRVGSWAKIQIDTETQPDIIWETTEIESGTIYRRRTSRLSADYSHLAKQFPDYPTKPVEQQDTPVLSPKRLNSEETSSPGKKSRGKVSPIKQQQTSKNYGSRIKHLQAKLFPVKPQSLNVKTTIARWPVA